MLRDSNRSVRAKEIAIATSCAAFTEFLKVLLSHWKFEIREVGTPDVVLLAEEGCAEPVGEQEPIWLTRSKYQGTDRLSLPLNIENFWQALEHRFHKPPRMRIRMDVELVASATVDEQTEKVVLNSLSDMGCRFSYHREMVRDQKVLLSLPVDGDELMIESRVIYSHYLSATTDSDFRVGLLFQGISVDQHGKLRDYMTLRFLEEIEKDLDRDCFRKALEYCNLSAGVIDKLEI